MNHTKIDVIASESHGEVSPLLHGHFAEHLGRCCYDGLFMGEDTSVPTIGGFRQDVVDAFKAVGVPILRWPGGCFADMYHWRDGVGPVRERPKRWIESCNIRSVDPNTLGTHEFLNLCQMIGAEPYLAGNVGSGSPQEMVEWLQYCNDPKETTLGQERIANGHPMPYNVKYWGVGNENWGCGGHYDAVTYGKEYRRYATFMRRSQQDLQLVACGFEVQQWNLDLLETLKDHLWTVDHLSIHRYYNAGPATGFSNDDYYSIMRAGDLIESDILRTWDLISFFARGKKDIKIAFDEWGVWHPQAVTENNYEATSTIRDAVAAASVLDSFQKHCDKVSMSNIAQIVNVLQALVQTKGQAMWLTPTYHTFALYAPHRGGTAVRADVDGTTIEAPMLSNFGKEPLKTVSASATAKDGKLIVSASNRHLTDSTEVAVSLHGSTLASPTGTILAGTPDAANTAEATDVVNTQSLEVDVVNGALMFVLPPCSVATVIASM